MKRGCDDGDILGMNTPRKKKALPEEPEEPVERNNVSTAEIECGIDVDSLTDLELSRYSSWKKTVFSTRGILEMIKPYSEMSFSNIQVSVVSSCVKMFLGELIEDAVKNKDLPRVLTPGDIAEASSRLALGRRNVLPDYCRIIKRRNYVLEKPSPEEMMKQIPSWAH